MTRDSYFTFLVKVFRNHIVAEIVYFTNHTGWTEHKIVVLKPANKYQVICQCHNFKNILIGNSYLENILIEHSYQPASSISLWSKCLKTSFFTEPKITDCESETINHSNILMFHLLWRQIMQHMFFKTLFPLWFNMR